ncbi:hypothetical protein SAMN06309944_0933 [Micrococcales bacterium KH10]|nr:hypothetical protein SAMN06309944_0933 [Micrococcales bacterium KH10]
MTDEDDRSLDDDPTVVRGRASSDGVDDDGALDDDPTVVRTRGSATDDDVVDDDPTVIRSRGAVAQSGADLALDDDPTVIRRRPTSGIPTDDSTLDDYPTVVRGRASLAGVDDEGMLDDDPTAVRARVDIPDDDVTVVSGKRPRHHSVPPADEATVRQAAQRQVPPSVRDDLAVVSIPVDPSSPLSYERYELRKTGDVERGTRQDFTQPATRQRVTVPKIEQAPQRRKPRIRWRLVLLIVAGSCVTVGALALLLG